MKLAHLIAGAALAVVVAACGSASQSTVSPSVSPTELASPSPSPSATQAPASSAPAATEYRIKKGDTLYAIARRNKISLDVLLAANPQIKDPNKLKIGEVIYIPSK